MDSDPSVLLLTPAKKAPPGRAVALEPAAASVHRRTPVAALVLGFPRAPVHVVQYLVGL